MVLHVAETLGLVEALAELFVGSGSGSFPEIVATLLKSPELFTVATTVKVALAPLAKLPIAQVGELHVPLDGVALTNV